MILQVSIGLQFRVTKRVDLRAGAGYMHFSDAFVVLLCYKVGSSELIDLAEDIVA
jgi:hypothetical protein